MATRDITLLTRRQILRAAALGGGGLVLTACGAAAPVGGGPTASAAATATTTATPAPRAVAPSPANRDGGVAAAGTATHVTAATPVATPFPAPAAALAGLLATIPAAAVATTPAPGTVWYADLLAQRRTYGFAAIDTPERLLALPRDEFLRFVAIYNGLPLLGLLGGAVTGDGVGWRPLVGFDSFQFDRAVYVGPGQEFTAWNDVAGALDPAAIAARLGAIGYAPRQDHGATILARGDQIAAARAARDASGFALAVAEALPGPGTLLATRLSGGVAATLDARAGAAPALADDPDYRAAAAALGRVVGAALVPGATLLRPVTQGIVVPATPSPTPYTTPLPAYRVAGFGFADDGAARQLTLALVYDDPAAAAAAGPILRARLATHRLDPRLARDGRTALTDWFAVDDARIVATDGRATLVQPLPLTGNWPGLWLALLQPGQVGFLRER